MSWPYITIALFAGAVLPMQAAINARLREAVGSPVVAALVSFSVGTVALLAYAWVGRSTLPDARMVSQTSWWVWTGGLLGACYVLAAILVTPRLGASSLLGLALAGQLIAALVMDHYGLLGLSVQPLSPLRLFGVLLLSAGVVLIVRY
jgi:bacterial/archaeal transporter family-2 protein